MGVTTPEPPVAGPGGPVPVAFTGRTSTLVMQDPAASLRRQVRECQAKLPPRTFTRYWADGPGYSNTYYACHHNPDDPRRTVPDTHPRTISVREDHLLQAIRDFFTTHIFGPDRAKPLADSMPATAADD
jgi:hypothetical protein